MKAITLVALAGCSQILGVADFHGAGIDASGTPGDGSSIQSIDAAIPVGPDAPPVNCAQISTQVNVCPDIGSASPIHITGNATLNPGTERLTLDSDGSLIPANIVNVGQLANGVTIIAVLATTFELDAGATLHAADATSDAMSVIASDTITIDGLIDVSGAGIGQFNTYCTGKWSGSGAGGFGSNTTAGGGGGGASMQGNGAAGGTGTLGGVVVAGAPVTPSAALPVEAPFGGCSGGEGTYNFGRANGGGAVYLASATGIVIAAGAGINAGGAGGGGGMDLYGGAGGGAGGTIMLEAPGVEMNGIVAANGGGGGQGGGNDTAATGQTGQLGTAAAQGGSTGTGGHGGAGGAGTTLAGSSGAAGSSVGGGGGGGGAGYIIVHSAVTTGTGVYSPAPMN